MRHVKIIHSADEHRRALNRASRLMDVDPEPNTPEADELELLTLVIEHYEQQQFHLDPPDPIEAIKFMMEQQGLRKKDLIPYIGSAPKVSEVLNGIRRLSLSMIRRLSEGMGIPASVLIQPVSRVRN